VCKKQSIKKAAGSPALKHSTPIAGSEAVRDTDIQRLCFNIDIEVGRQQGGGKLHVIRGALAVVAIHRQRVAEGITDQKDGVRVLGGNGTLPAGTGCFVSPTIVAGVAQNSRYFQEEIFGPVLTAQPFDTEDEAVAMANGTPYGRETGPEVLDEYLQT
jgi:hypothetical protein